MPPLKNLLAEYELRLTQRSGIALQFSAEQHGDLPDGVFNGQYITTFTLARRTTYSGLKKTVWEDSGWQASGITPPPPAMPSHLPIRSVAGQLGWRFSSQKSDTAHFRFFLQPGFRVVRHEFFTVSDALKKVFGKTEIYDYGQYPDLFRVIEEENLFRNERTMLQKHGWATALHYDLGTTFFATRYFFLEARILTWMMLTQPYKDYLPENLRRFGVRGQLLAGSRF